MIRRAETRAAGTVVVAAALLALALSAPSRAQDAGSDWDLVRDAAERRVTATVVYDSGIGLATRCTDGAFEVLLAGLPAAAGENDTRLLTIGVGEVEPYQQSWMNGSNRTVAFSQMPARFARTLREGGPMQIVVGGSGGEPNRRFIIDIPLSSAAVDETLTACDRPVTDPRDADRSWLVPENGPPAPLAWDRPPRPDFPDRAARAGLVRGYAVISCLSRADGRLERCEIESEHPVGYGLGRESLDGTRGARLRTTDGSPILPNIVTFGLRYVMEGYEQRD